MKKLVRDKIPEIIKSAGDEAEYKFSILPDIEYEKYLALKLQEELNEFTEAYEIEELVDLCEVVSAILKFREISEAELKSLMEKKRFIKGGFDKGILMETADSANDTE